jgi:DNA helicase HerA-like ATPase
MSAAAQKIEAPTNSVYIGGADAPQYLNLKYANRHGLIAGATGTGKTVTLQSIAESFSREGIPVFCADVKGDLAGISQAGSSNPKVDARLQALGISNFDFAANPTIFWDLYGKKGHPIRTTISEMGPMILSRLLDLNDVQDGVLNICFALADDEGLLLLDLKDLRAMLTFISENASDISKKYGNVAPASIAAIQRSLLVLEQQGGEQFFGEPALDIRDFMRTTHDGAGYVNVLAADTLIQSPKLYSTFLLWLLSELFEDLPEMGDLDKPKLAFFFDEAHLLFNDAPKALIEKIEQVVRLVRSKGVGVYFITQNPQDIPENVLGQLGNRFQHALRAFTPNDQKAVKVAAQTFRANPKFKTEDAITQLGVGEALVSTLADGGVPTIVERTFVCPPHSRIGTISDDERQKIIKSSPLAGMYDRVVDRESAFEKLNAKASKEPVVSQERKTQDAPRKSTRMGYGETVAKQVLRTVGAQVGRQLVRGLLGSLLR